MINYKNFLLFYLHAISIPYVYLYYIFSKFHVKTKQKTFIFFSREKHFFKQAFNKRIGCFNISILPIFFDPYA